MKRRMCTTIIAVLLAATIIGGVPNLSHAAGFWNYTDYTITFQFVGDGCLWVFRSLCGTWVELGPHLSWSSNNQPGWMTIGERGADLVTFPLEKDGNRYALDRELQIEVKNQGVVTFNIRGNRLFVDVYDDSTFASGQSFEARLE